MDLQTKAQAESLARKIKHYLITTMGVTLDEATDEEFYRAFALTLREEIMIAWTACTHTYKKTGARMLYYLCMEYMPGRFSTSNVTNIHALDLIQYAMKILNKNLSFLSAYEPDPGLGNGGLGRLAACLLDSLATQQYPAIGYGLRFQYGIFDQEIWAGEQMERPDIWLLHENPWEYRRDVHAVSVHYAGRAEERKSKEPGCIWEHLDFDEVRALAYDIPIIGYKANGCFTVNTLRLWTTKESPRNFQLQRYNAGFLDQAAENTSLTDVLYPNDNHETGKRVRLKQEFLLVSASLQDIVHQYISAYPDMQSFADKVRIHINDTHPALAIAELQRLLMEKGIPWKEAFEIVQQCCNFTNHTVLKESLEEWNQQRMHHLLPVQYAIIERLNLEFCNKVRARFLDDEAKIQRLSILQEGQVKMANLAIVGSHKINGVAALHTEILKETVFKDFYDVFPDRFVNVTNGVTQRRWLLHCNPGLSQFLKERIGSGWITDFKQIANLATFAKDPLSQRQLLEIKRNNKTRLIEFIKEKNPLRDAKGQVIDYYTTLDETALFDVQIKRVHEYKRQLMNILHVIMVYQELKKNPASRKVKRCVIFAGKAAPGYVVAKNILHLIFLVARKINQDPEVAGKLHVIFIENYNVSKAEIIIPAADLSEQISTAGMEASGTGNMKLAINGALTIGTEDGANVEMHQAVPDPYWPFAFGSLAQENKQLRESGSYNPWELYIHDAQIHEALDALRDRTFANSDQEHELASSFYHLLLDATNGHQPDQYFVLKDLRSYYETQKKVEDLYLQENLWAEYVMHNIAAMGSFSSDEAIHNYAKKVWDLTPCPCDVSEVARVRAEYSEHDQCRIL